MLAAHPIGSKTKINLDLAASIFLNIFSLHQMHVYLQVFALSFVWFTRLCVQFVFSQSDHVGFAFMTLG